MSENDNGRGISYDALRDKLQLPTISTEKVIIKEFGNVSGTLKTCDSIQIAIEGADNLTVFINAFVVDNICSPVANQAIDVAKLKYPHIKDLPLADKGSGMDEFEVDILIGADYIWQFMLDHVVRGEQGYGPVATLTRFGYVLNGPVEIPSTNEHSSNIIISHVLKTDNIVVDSDKHLINELHKFWDIESMGIKSNEQELTCSENPLEGKIHFNQKLGKYEISLPFKEDHPVIADNYQVARKRLESLLKRLNSKPDVLHQYNEVISEQLNSGVVEKSDNEFVQTVEKSLYIDDFAFSLDTEEESFELYRKLKLCFASGGFNMRKWASNSDSLIERIELAENMHSKTANSKESNVIFDDDETFTKSISNTVCNGTESKILGMPWNRNNDKFVFDFSEFIEAASSTVEVTKRNILRTTARFFDPLGVLSPQIEINTNVVVTENNDQLNLNKIIPCVNYSSFIRLIRVTALVLKFVAILKGKVKNLQTDISDDFLSKVNEAKIMWHLEVQKVFDLSGNDKEIRNNLGCFVDKEGIIRVGGRLQNASISYNSKHPVLLPRQHHFTKLVIWHSHLTVKHNGVNETLAEVRSNYWITKGRQIVKSLIAKCSRCKAIHGKPYETPNAPPLPAYRVSEDAAFTNVAVDFAGPLYVKDIYTKTDRMNKCYIALFSCANTRAIHLELVPDLFAETFIRALKRFTARRGLSKLIVSDNGKTFLDKNVQMYAQNMNIRWIFNVPTASWWGGWFKKEYIPSLHERHRCLKNPKRVIQVGDIVHIFRDKVPKHTWAMGKVVKLLTGRDGLVRAAEIKTLDKSRRVIYIKRPIQRLYPLEVNANEENSTEIEHLNGQKEHEPSITMVRDEDIREHIANII
eukprot:gene5673-10913_t